MDTIEKITLWTALWGAVTGTVALIIQFAQHHSDRAILKLDAVLSIVSDQTSKARVVFTLKVVNHGRRIIRIESAGIEIPSTNAVIPEGVTMVSNDLFVFQSELTGNRVELDEGDNSTFGPYPLRRELISAFGRRATAFVVDTRGKRYRVQFDVIPEDALPND